MSDELYTQNIRQLELANPQREVGNIVSTANVEDCNRQFKMILGKLNVIDGELKQAAAQGHAETIAALEIAMTKLFKVALYVHGNYDSGHDQAKTQELLTRAVIAFAKMENVAEDALDLVTKLNTIATRVKAREVAAFRNKVEEAKKAAKEEYEKSEQQIEELKARIPQLEQSMVKNQRYIDENERLYNSPLADIGAGALQGLAWIGGKTAKLFGDDGYDHCEKPLEALARVRRSLVESKLAVAQCHGEITNAECDLRKLNMVQDKIEVLIDQIPQLLEESERLVTTTDMTMKALVELKQIGERLVAGVRVIEEAAGFTTSTLDNKADIGLSILDVCQNALIDKNLIDEVQMITDELAKGYEGMEMPQKMEMKLVETRQVLETMPLIQAAA